MVPDASLKALYGVVGVKVGCCHRHSHTVTARTSDA